MRRKSRHRGELEKLSVADALNAIRFAEVWSCCSTCEQRLRGAGSAHRRLDRARRARRGDRGGTMDLADMRRGAIGKCAEQADKTCQSKNVPLVAVSGLTGEGLDRLCMAVSDAYRSRMRRVPTSALNRWFEDAVSAHPPPAVSGRRSSSIHHAGEGRPPSLRPVCTQRTRCRRL